MPNKKYGGVVYAGEGKGEQIKCRFIFYYDTMFICTVVDGGAFVSR